MIDLELGALQGLGFAEADLWAKGDGGAVLCGRGLGTIIENQFSTYFPNA